MLTRNLLILIVIASAVLCDSEVMDKTIKDVENEKDAVLEDLKVKMTRDVKLKEVIDNGFKNYSQHTKTEYFGGVSEDNISGFANFLVGKLEINSENKEEFIANIEASLFSDDSSSIKYIDFVDGKTGGATYKGVVVDYEEEKGKVNFLVSNIRASFKVGDAIFVTRSQRSFCNGALKKTFKVTRLPKTITQESVLLIFKYFKAVAFDRFAKFRNVN